MLEWVRQRPELACIVMAEGFGRKGSMSGYEEMERSLQLAV